MKGDTMFLLGLHSDIYEILETKSRYVIMLVLVKIILFNLLINFLCWFFFKSRIFYQTAEMIKFDSKISWADFICQKKLEEKARFEQIEFLKAFLFFSLLVNNSVNNID